MSTTTVRRFLCALSLLVLAALLPASAAHATMTVSISGPTSIWVPYLQCVSASWTAVTNNPVTYYSWSYDGSVVSTTGGWGTQYCSPGLSYVVGEDHSLQVTVIGNAGGNTASESINVGYEAGCGTTGCGFQIFCDCGFGTP